MECEESRDLSQVAIRFMKRLEKEETVLPFCRCTDQWRNEVGVVSKQLNKGVLFLPFLTYLLEKQAKTHRIAGLEPTEDGYTEDCVLPRVHNIRESIQHAYSSQLHHGVLFTSVYSFSIQKYAISHINIDKN